MDKKAESPHPNPETTNPIISSLQNKGCIFIWPEQDLSDQLPDRESLCQKLIQSWKPDPANPTKEIDSTQIEGIELGLAAAYQFLQKPIIKIDLSRIDVNDFTTEQIDQAQPKSIKIKPQPDREVNRTDAPVSPEKQAADEADFKRNLWLLTLSADERDFIDRNNKLKSNVLMAPVSGFFTLAWTTDNNQLFDSAQQLIGQIQSGTEEELPYVLKSDSEKIEFLKQIDAFIVDALKSLED